MTLSELVPACKPDNATQRVRVLKCKYEREHHLGRTGWLLEGFRVSVDPGESMVMLDEPIDPVFQSSGHLCVATEVEYDG